MTTALAVVAGVVAAWFLSRRLGRATPCPAALAWLIDNRFTRAVSGTSTLVRRADVQGGMRVLDAGCGPGRLSIPLARQVGPSGEVVALDVQEGMLERVRRRAADEGLANIRTVLAPLSPEAPFLAAERRTFDRVVLVTVLGEIPDPVAALTTLRSVLRPDGILSITEAIIDPHYQSRGAVRRMAERAGFRVDSIFGTAIAFTMNLRAPGV